jgi:hypothetical protein
MVDTPTVVEDTPWSPHGETAENPIPVPKSINTSEITAAPVAPAKIAGHETPCECSELGVPKGSGAKTAAFDCSDGVFI